MNTGKKNYFSVFELLKHLPYLFRCSDSHHFFWTELVQEFSILKHSTNSSLYHWYTGSSSTYYHLVRKLINPLPHMLYLEDCIISINNSNFQIFSKNYFLHFNSFENIMENGTFAPQEQISIFHNILKNLTFQRRPKALVWSIGLINTC